MRPHPWYRWEFREGIPPDDYWQANNQPVIGMRRVMVDPDGNEVDPRNPYDVAAERQLRSRYLHRMRPEHTQGHGPYHPDNPSDMPPDSPAQESRPCDHAYVAHTSRGGHVVYPGGRGDPNHTHCWHTDTCCTCGLHTREKRQ